MSGMLAGAFIGGATIGGAGAIAGGALLGGSVGSFVSGNRSARDAANSATQSAQIQANADMEALNYLKEINALPQDIKEQALTGLQGIYLPEGGATTQDQMIAQAQSSPLYKAILGTRQAGEDSILRNASATGGLRSGNTNSALYQYNQQLDNEALLTAYQDQMQGVRSLAGVPTNENMIASTMSGIGGTLAAGNTAAAQARQQGTQNMINNSMGIANLGLQGYAAGLFSDIRLKKNIKRVGRRNGFNWYTWDWVANAKVLGLTGSSEGVLAHQVYEKHPEAIGVREGFLTVMYDALGIEEMANA